MLLNGFTVNLFYSVMPSGIDVAVASGTLASAMSKKNIKEPNRNGLQPTRMASTLEAMASNLIAMASHTLKLLNTQDALSGGLCQA